MWKLHRYYLREVATSSALVFTVLFGVVLISTVYRGIKRAEGFGVLAAAKTTFYWAADALPHLLPISFLFATVLTFARASQDREITAIRAAGISPRVVMTSALLVGIVCSLFGSWSLHWLVPQAHYMKYRVVAEQIRQVLLTTGMTGDTFSMKGLTMTWERRNEEGHWEDVQILVQRDGEELQILERGLWLADEAWVEVVDGERLAMVLLNTRDALGQNELPERLSPSVSISAIAESTRRDEGDKDLASDQLLAEVYRGVHPNEVTARYYFHQRACFALLPILFAPLGFCIGVLARDRGRMLALVYAMAPVFVFYLGDFIGNKLVRTLGEPVAAWCPAFLLVLLGGPFCWRLLRF